MNDAGVGIKYIAQSINRSEKEMVGKREKIFSYRNYMSTDTSELTCVHREYVEFLATSRASAGSI